MKRFEIAGSDYFDADEAQAEIDRLKAENAELLAALEDLLGEHEALTASAFVVHEKARFLIDKERGGS